LPSVSAALIADNGSQSVPVALFQAASATVASINATGGITATLTNAAGTEIVCYTAGTNGLMTYEPSVAGCVPSDPLLKDRGADLKPEQALAALNALVPGSGTFKAAAHLDSREHVWLYADQVCDMDARLCERDASGTRNYDKVGIMAYAVAAIKELKADNDNLKVEVERMRRASSR
jgi:hypothetical protein